MLEIKSPPEHLLAKLELENPAWTADDWEHWWCKWWMKRDPTWALLPKCAKCDCWRSANA